MLANARYSQHPFKGTNGQIQVATLLRIFEVIGPRTPRTKTLWVDAFDEALRQFRLKNWDVAEAGFKRVLDLRGKDGPSEFYLARIPRFREQPPAKDWIGEITMDEK